MTKKLLVAVLILALIVICACTKVVASTQLNNEVIEIESVVEETKEGNTVPEVIVINTEDTENTIESKVAKCNVNVRYDPCVESAIYKIINRGEEVTYTDNGTNWGTLNIDGQNYYIDKEFLVTKEEWEELDKTPYCDEIPLSEDLQKYLWNECQDTGVDYCFALAIIDRETGGTFNPNIISKTHDYGLFQCNRCWKSTFKKLGIIQESMDELLNPYNSIHAGLYLLSQYVAEYGPSQAAAFKYNTGHGGANSSNAYSRDVYNNRYPKWQQLVYGSANQ